MTLSGPLDSPTTGPLDGVCRAPVTTAAMIMDWDELTFLHWRYPPEAVQRVLPEGLEVEPFDGSAWVGLVPFFLGVALPHTSPMPWMSQFAETNVRTYVRGRNGEVGVWFFSLDAARLGAVLTARSWYRLPYFWSHMRLHRIPRPTQAAPARDGADESGAILSYECRRRWPGPLATSRVAVEVGERFDPSELHELDHFLTARWALFSAPRKGISFARAEHAPWPLHRARVLHLDDELVPASGLAPPQGDPIVHWSPRLEVRVGWPRAIVSG
jgi:uncharacterized protein YqjF (DUF2071 family)